MPLKIKKPHQTYLVPNVWSLDLAFTTILRGNLNWQTPSMKIKLRFKDCFQDTLKKYCHPHGRLRKLASDKPSRRATIHRSVEEYVSNRIKHQQLKRPVRKDELESINIESEKFQRSLWGRLCLSRTGLASLSEKNTRLQCQVLPPLMYGYYVADSSEVSLD